MDELILTVDMGNTRSKWVLWSYDGKLIEERVAVWEEAQDLILRATKIAWCSTQKNQIWNWGKHKSAIFDLNELMNWPFLSHYKTPETLGKDRIAAIAGARKKYYNQSALIIDAGTCITTDFLTAQGEYLGGSISPGIHMRYKAMHEFTGKLPLLTPAMASEINGKSTSDSLHSGVWYGVLAEINNRMELALISDPKSIFVLTGGDASLLADHLKYRIFAEPLLVHHGLLYCLEINEF